VGTGASFIVRSLFTSTPVFESPSIVFAAGIKNDRHLFLAAFAAFAPVTLSPILDGSGMTLMGGVDAGGMSGRVWRYRVNSGRSDR
jgi:hypothetical protein